MKSKKFAKTPENTTIHDQTNLLSINIHDSIWIEDGLPGADVIPLYLDQENALWVLYVKLKPDTQVVTHFHSGMVHLFTTKGSWYYLEHAEERNIQKAGSYLFEPGGSYHTLRSDEGCEFFNLVMGSNINFDADGQFVNILDAGWIRDRITEICKEKNIEEPRYIKAGEAKFTK